MTTTFTSRKCTLKDSFKERAEKKMAKIERLMGADATATVKVTVEKAYQVVEITLRQGSLILRAEEAADDMIDALDGSVDSLIRKIRKNKTRVGRQLRTPAFDAYLEEQEHTDEEETEFELVRTKEVYLKPQTVDEAILQMNMLGHKFYMFMNGQTEEINVVYCRKGGGYGLLQPEAN